MSAAINHRALPITVRVTVFDGGTVVHGFDVKGQYTIREHFAMQHIHAARRQAVAYIGEGGRQMFTLDETAPCSEELKELIRAHVEQRTGERHERVRKIVRNPLAALSEWSEDDLPLQDKHFTILWTTRSVEQSKEIVFATRNPHWENEAALMALRHFVRRPSRFIRLKEATKRRLLRDRARDLSRLLGRDIKIETSDTQAAMNDIKVWTSTAVEQFNREVSGA